MLVDAAGKAYRAEMDRRAGSERRKNPDGSGRRASDRPDVEDEVDLSDAAIAAMATDASGEEGDDI